MLKHYKLVAPVIFRQTLSGRKSANDYNLFFGSAHFLIINFTQNEPTHVVLYDIYV